MLSVSSGERVFIEDGISQGVRTDGNYQLACILTTGRSLTDYRVFSLETGIVSQANGSARLKLSGTDVLVGVKLEVTKPDPETPNYGKLHFSVEW